MFLNKKLVLLVLKYQRRHREYGCCTPRVMECDGFSSCRHTSRSGSKDTASKHTLSGLGLLDENMDEFWSETLSGRQDADGGFILPPVCVCAKAITQTRC